MIKKYEFTGETKYYSAVGHVQGKTLHRIRRISDGLVGGFVEKEENLSQDGSCFVYDNAEVYGDAKVVDDATVYDNVSVRGNAVISENAIICDAAVCERSARVGGNSLVSGRSHIYGWAQISGRARVNDSIVNGHVQIKENAVVNEITVSDRAIIAGDTIIKSGRTAIVLNREIELKHGVIEDSEHIITICMNSRLINWRGNGKVTFCRDEESGKIYFVVHSSDFSGESDEFVSLVRNQYNSSYEEIARNTIEYIRRIFELADTII